MNNQLLECHSRSCMSRDKEILPYFPLSVFLFPGEDIPLRIFEPRYKQLIEDVRTTGNSFAIPFVTEQKIQHMGCEVRVKEVLAENPGGRMVITVESLAVVEIVSFKKQLEGKLYSGGKVERMPHSDSIQDEGLVKLVKDYCDHFDSEFLHVCEHSEISHQDVMKALNLSSDEKYKFICMPGTVQKESYLAGQLRYLKMIRKQETLLGDDFGLN